MLYKRLCTTLTKYKLIPETDDVFQYIQNIDVDHYESIYLYDEEQFQVWRKSRTVAGMTKVITKKLIFDFDSKENVVLAQNDTINLVQKLLSLDVQENCIQVAFSGSKGFSVQIIINKELTPSEFKTLVFNLASEYETFDKVVNDAQRVFRIIGTKHPKSGLYKLPLSVTQLCELDITQIRELAKSVDNIDNDLLDSYQCWNIPHDVLELKNKKEKKKENAPVVLGALDLTRKPKWLIDSKFALQEGFFETGERSNALTIMAATYKAQGFPKEITYRILKGIVEKQSERTGQERFDNDEIWNNIIGQVYGPNWTGGTYSYENTPLLQDVTNRLGLNPPGKTTVEVFKISDMSKTFSSFATNIDENTIKLGIKDIDDNIRITTSMLVGLVGAPSVGKSTSAFDLLHNASKNGVHSFMASMDMGVPLVFQRLVQKHTGLKSQELFDLYKNNDPKIQEFSSVLEENYSNVSFCFKSGLTVEDLQEQIIKRQEELGIKFKLVLIDYLETMSSQFSDTVSSHSYIAQKLKDLANELECTVILLLQPQKLVGGPSEPILNYTKIKGSSAIQQACSIILSVWRPGFNPQNPNDDRYISFACLKNRLGGIGSWDFAWDGLRGSIKPLTEIEKTELAALLERKASERTEDL